MADLWTMADDLVLRVLEALAACGRPAPGHSGVVPGGGDFEPGFCCEGQVWARMLTSPPTVQGNQPDNCAEFGWQATFEVGVARCAPRNDMSGLQPIQLTAAQLSAAAQGQYRDGQALAHGVVDTVAAWRGPLTDPFDDGWLDATVGALSWMDRGRCLGSTIQVRAMLTGWCCNEAITDIIDGGEP